MANLPKHSVFPKIWNVNKPVPNKACAGCAMQSLPDHATCTAMTFSAPIPNDSRLSLKLLRKWQYLVQRMDRDAVGVIGALLGTNFNILYNARDSVNYADQLGGVVTAVGNRTITIDFGNINPREYAIYVNKQAATDFGFGSVQTAQFGSVQPGMIIEFMWPSALATKAHPTIKRVLSSAGNVITYEIDQDVSAALTSTFEGYTDTFNCKVWNQLGNEEKWVDVQTPHYFLGKRKVKAIDMATLPENGIFKIGDFAVAHPQGFQANEGILNFTIEYYHEGTWINLNGSDRLFIRTYKDGNLTKYESVIALGTERPEWALFPEDAMTDLRSYQPMRVTYWQPASDVKASCKTPCYDRCIHSRIDYTRSIGNYGIAPGITIAPDEQRDILVYNPEDGGSHTTTVTHKGYHHYCAKRRHVTYELIDTDDPPDGILDTAIPTWHTNPAAVNFPKGGKCNQYGVCAHFEGSENNGSRTGFFDYTRHAGKFFRELWGAANTRLVQLFPGYPYHWNFQLQRIFHASIQWNQNMHLEVPITYSPTREFYKGHWGTATITYTESANDPADPGAENTRLRLHSSYDWDVDPDGVIADGSLPAVIPNFKPSRDPLDPVGTIENNHIERLGINNVKDEGDLAEGGISSWPKALPDSIFIIPNVSTIPVGIEDRQVAKFERFENPILIGGKSIGGCIQINPLRQPEKGEESVGSRIIHSATVIGGGVELEFTNTRHSYSYINYLNPRQNSYHIWMGGGGYPLLPKTPLRINSESEPNKLVGAPVIERGDSIEISGATDYQNWKFLLSEVAPHDGGYAPSWGDHKVLKADFEADGFWATDSWSGGVFTDNYGGRIQPPATGQMVSGGGITTWTSVSFFGSRPQTLDSGQYFVDQNANRIYFSPDNEDAFVTIRFSIEGADPQVDHTTNHTIDTMSPVITDINWTDWDAAANKTCKHKTTDIAYTATNIGGKLAVEVGGNYAGRDITIEGELIGENPTPPDDVSNQGVGYLAIGRKRDRARLTDESGLVIADVGNLPGRSATFHRNAATYVPSISLSWLEYSTQTWQAISTSNYISEHGRGNIWILESWFTDKPEKVCFKT